jgi:hypothetical protein
MQPALKFVGTHGRRLRRRTVARVSGVPVHTFTNLVHRGRCLVRGYRLSKEDYRITHITWNGVTRPCALSQMRKLCPRIETSRALDSAVQVDINPSVFRGVLKIGTRLV